MKAMQYQTLSLMSWTLGLFFMFLSVFTATYYTIGMYEGSVYYVDYPFRRWSIPLDVVGFILLCAGVELLWRSQKNLEKGGDEET